MHFRREQRRFFYALVFSSAALAFGTFLFQVQAFGNEKDPVWLPQNRPQIRSKITECITFLSPLERKVVSKEPPAKFEFETPRDKRDAKNFRVNDSVGIPISTNDPEQFRKDLRVLIQAGKGDIFKGAILFITGIDMGKENQTRAMFQKVLEEEGLSPNDTKIRVLSIPRDSIEGEMQSRVRILWNHFKYFLPSVDRSYQTPLSDEVAGSLGGAVAVEALNVVYLLKTLPPVDASLVVSTHAALIGLYSVYAQFLTNWILLERPKSNVISKMWPRKIGPIWIPTIESVEGFSKQAIPSAPFIANFAILSSTTKILEYLASHSSSDVALRSLEELINIVKSQSITFALQTLFYRQVITKGVLQWQNSHVGVERSEAARGAAKILQIPILALNAIALSRASNPRTALSGQLMLIGLIFAGLPLQKWPQMLDPAIPMYIKMKTSLEAIKNGYNNFKSYPLMQLNLASSAVSDLPPIEEQNR